jgi:hypothetical protein
VQPSAPQAATTAPAAAQPAVATPGVPPTGHTGQ